MDTASSSNRESQYKIGAAAPIVADELNHYASEFFLVNNWVEKYSVKTDAEVVLDLRAANQATEHTIEQSADAVADDALVEVKLPQTINFWTAPIRYKKETVAAPVIDFRASSAAVPGCSCPDCVPVSTPTAGARHASILSIKRLAPLGWCALLIVCSASVISQLMALGSTNCEQARRLSDSGQYLESLRASALAIRCNPFSSRSYYERGRALIHMLGYREAEECLNRCLAIKPDDVSALDARAALSLKIEKPVQTISDSTRLIALSGGSLNALQYGNMAAAYYKRCRYDDAIKFYEKAMACGSNNIQLGLGRTYCLAGKQQHKQALAACDGLIKQYGAKSQVLALRGYCLERLHDLAGAEKDFDLALAKEPTNATYYGYRAALMAELNKPDAALNDYRKAADNASDCAQAQWVVAKKLTDLGRDKEALRYYDRLAQFSSFQYSFDQHQERSALNYKAGHYLACLADLKRAIELKPDCNLHVMEALCFARLGQAGQARATIAEAYRLRPESPSVVLGEAHVETILGQTLSAVDKYSKVLASGDNREALIGRGECYLGRKQWASAAEDFKRALALGVADTGVKSNLAKCERELTSGAKIALDIPTCKIVDMAKLDRVGLFDNGRRAYQNGDMQLASIYFAELAKREPANLVARNSLAHSLEGSGNHQEAIAVFEPLSQRDQLAVNDQFCYAHALAASGLYERSIAIMQRLQNGEPANMIYRLELTKMFSASGQTDKAIGMCRDSLAMRGSSEELKSLNNVYESLVTEKLRSKRDGEGAARATSATLVETEG